MSEGASIQGNEISRSYRRLCKMLASEVHQGFRGHHSHLGILATVEMSGDDFAIYRMLFAGDSDNKLMEVLLPGIQARFQELDCT